MPFHGPIHGPGHGPKHGVTRGSYFGGITVGRDGPGNVYVPVSNSDFAQLGIAAPASIWLCQEASGNLADVNAVSTLTANSTPAYRQAVAGWTRLAVTVADNTVQRFFNTTTVPSAGATSVAILAYYLVPTAAPAAERGCLQVGTNVDVRLNTTPWFRQVTVGAGVIGSSNPTGAATVRPLLLVYDRTNTLVRAFSDQEQINGTYNAGGTGPAMALGDTAVNSATQGYLWAACWSGANAETIGKTTLQALAWSLAY